jgi:hypothetical protein
MIPALPATIPTVARHRGCKDRLQCKKHQFGIRISRYSSASRNRDQVDTSRARICDLEHGLEQSVESACHASIAISPLLLIQSNDSAL